MLRRKITLESQRPTLLKKKEPIIVPQESKVDIGGSKKLMSDRFSHLVHYSQQEENRHDGLTVLNTLEDKD